MPQLHITDFRFPGLAAAIFAMFAIGVLAVPLTSSAQQPPKVYRIGFLGNINSFPADSDQRDCPTKGSLSWQALVDGLRQRGYVQSQNLIIECRWTGGRPERATALATDLVRLDVDLLLAFTTLNVRAAKEATSAVPIVMLGIVDPVGKGLVASLARPGGNVTGLADDAGKEIAGKYLQLLKEAVPQISRVAVLQYLFDPPESVFGADLEAAARALKVTLQIYDLREPEKLDGAFAAMAKARAEALLVLPHPFMWDHRRRIVDLAAQSQLPAVYPGREMVEVGGLLAYDGLRPDRWRSIGQYVDKIFKGAKPGDLPIEQPTTFALIINLKTAKSLGLTIPPSLLQRADVVIQ
jgi:putative ABC transport system substrate-binding protein